MKSFKLLKLFISFSLSSKTWTIEVIRLSDITVYFLCSTNRNNNSYLRWMIKTEALCVCDCCIYPFKEWISRAPPARTARTDSKSTITDVSSSHLLRVLTTSKQQRSVRGAVPSPSHNLKHMVSSYYFNCFQWLQISLDLWVQSGEGMATLKQPGPATAWLTPVMRG